MIECIPLLAPISANTTVWFFVFFIASLYVLTASCLRLNVPLRQ